MHWKNEKCIQLNCTILLLQYTFLLWQETVISATLHITFLGHRIIDPSTALKEVRIYYLL